MAELQDVFSDYAQRLETDAERRQTLRDIVKDIEIMVRRIQANLQKVHIKGTNVAQACSNTDEFFEGAKKKFLELQTHIPTDQFYRVNGMWAQTVQALTFWAAFIKFLKDGTLIEKDDVADMLGLTRDRTADGDEGQCPLPLEDYLIGLCQLSNELSRLCVTSVTAEEFSRPPQISAFLAELYAGFRLLNLKNDILRKRFDSIKYDVKKVEEVMYDLRIRKLLPE